MHANSEQAPYEYECTLVQCVSLYGSLCGKIILKIEKASGKSWFRRNSIFVTHIVFSYHSIKLDKKSLYVTKGYCILTLFNQIG